MACGTHSHFSDRKTRKQGNGYSVWSPWSFHLFYNNYVSSLYQLPRPPAFILSLIHVTRNVLDSNMWKAAYIILKIKSISSATMNDWYPNPSLLSLYTLQLLCQKMLYMLWRGGQSECPGDLCEMCFTYLSTGCQPSMHVFGPMPAILLV